ncbi:MAG: phosphosulfolactate synthase [Rikenellaceae bacterium]
MKLPFLPHRGIKPRVAGLTMVMDKGLYECQVEGLCELAAPHIDFIKLGFGTSLFTGGLESKLQTYRKYGVKVYPGGTLFEAFYLRGMVDEFETFMEENHFETLEISDGSVIMPHSEKCKLIERFSKKYQVLSEVGSKVAGVEVVTEDWISMMKDELNAGSDFVIAEAREAGNVGIFDGKGQAKSEMIGQIVSCVPQNKIIWEAPTKSQQVWFVKELGANVNLGNIAADEILSLETIRCGLRGDTFGLHLPEELKVKVQ